MEPDEVDLHNQKGQALVEYALILVLVGLAVVVVLALLGPALGKTYSNVVASVGNGGGVAHAAAGPTSTPVPVPTAGPSPTPDWVFCSDEYQICSFSGTKQVRYGVSGVYVVLTLTGGTPCENAVFGDPWVGVLKHCWTR